jgi:hypothetical protein
MLPEPYAHGRLENRGASPQVFDYDKASLARATARIEPEVACYC